MQSLFIVVSLAGAAYFLLLRPGFDFYSLAFFSSLVYFSPGFFGYDLLFHPLEPDTYAVFVVVLASVWVAGVLRPMRTPPAADAGGMVPQVAALAAGAVVAFVLWRYGFQSLFVPKTETPIPGAAFIGWRILSSLAVLYGLISRNRVVLALGGVCLLLMFFTADRTGVAMTLFAAAVEVIGRKGRISVLRGTRRFLLPLVLGLVLVWGGKAIHVAVQRSVRQDDVRIGLAVLSNPAALRMLTTRSEPFITVATLNEGLRRDYYIGPGHLVGVVYQLWPAPSMLGHKSNEFNTIFQADLFPGAPKNTLAYNPWAEAMFSGGWLLLLIYVAIYIAGLELANLAARASRAGVRGMGLLLGAYWAFYLHRNSMASILAYEKHIVYVGVIILGVSALLPRVAARVATAREPRTRLGADGGGEPALRQGGRA